VLFHYGVKENMKKVFFVVALTFLLLVNSCKKESPYPTLPANQSVPTLSWAIASFASVTRFYPFGDTSLGNPANTGYQMILSDTTTAIFSACTGIVQSITPTGKGMYSVTVKYKSNSPYTFIYSGLGHVNVHVNDSLQNSALLGTIAHNGIMGFSLVKNGHTAICPSLMAADGFNNSINTAMSLSNYKTPEDSIMSPCLVDSIAF
jgi:hypothetical protein